MATSKLQQEVGEMLDAIFPNLGVQENARPDWLISSNFTKLELDFYIEPMNLAFEIQGKQHYEFTPHFHKNIAAFEKQKLYDEEKRNLCKGAGIRLVEIASSLDALIELGKMDKSHPAFQKLAILNNLSIAIKSYQTVVFYGEKKQVRKSKRARYLNKVVIEQENIKLTGQDIEDIKRWRSRAISWHKQGKGNAEDWQNKHLSEDIAAPIRKMLKDAKTEDEIKLIFESTTPAP